VAEPVADGHEIHAGLEEMNRGGMSHGVWVDALLRQGGSRRDALACVLPHEVPNPEARDRLAESVAEQLLAAVQCDTALCDQAPERISGLWPKRTDTLLATLAVENNLQRTNELKVSWPEVHDLLDPCAGVEHCEQQRVIAATVGAGEVRAIEEDPNLVGIKVLHDSGISALERDGEQTLAQLDVLRVAGRCVPRERMNGGQPNVPRRSSVAPMALEMVQKGEDLRRFEIIEVQEDDRSIVALRQEAEKERESVSIAPHGVRAGSADLRKMIGEESPKTARQRVRSGGSHRPPPLAPGSMMPATWSANRSLAASKTGSRSLR
jgi:hypothetical protein